MQRDSKLLRTVSKDSFSFLVAYFYLSDPFNLLALKLGSYLGWFLTILKIDDRLTRGDSLYLLSQFKPTSGFKQSA